ncbi:MAG: hypothetical protein GY944_11705, partial [bacterium]|nr:hypothetical protein [bacterium]
MLDPRAATSRSLALAFAVCLALTIAAMSRAAEPTYVGSAACADCHPEQARRWQGSHHDRALERATDATVLGDFEDAEYTQHGVTTRFFRRGDRFVVHTEGPGGTMKDFEVAYTFGVEPLQQYLIAFPDGRLQALGIAWDSRQASARGQRWFSVYGDEAIPHDDVLHWTKPSQNWNHMCAECHSTNLRKRYDAARDSFDTQWSEIDVACEACHGPGSIHRDRMQSTDAKLRESGASGLTIALPPVTNARWETDSATGNPVRKPARRKHTEVELCARCHSRRSTLAEGVHPGRPIHDSHRISLLESDLYHADGQILDEVYVYGSFVQSAMYAAGVTCSDCHDPHTTKLRAQGNALCTRCHTPERYDGEKHHHHEANSAGASCVECHMPSRTYMQVDTRHDHSLRVPRPDLSTTLGTPNACNDCHTSTTSTWAARKIESWFGPRRKPRPLFAAALHAARTNALDAEQQLLSILGNRAVPAIARATAVTLLPRFASQRSMSAFPRALTDDDALVRTAAVEALEGLPPQKLSQWVTPLLDDPARVVRWEAARVLAGLPAELLGPKATRTRDRLLSEYRIALTRDADRAQPHMQLAALAIAQERFDEAERELLLAKERNPSFVPAYVNLADLHRARGNDEASEQTLRAALEAVPDHPDIRHALGLALVRLDRDAEALVEL